MKMKKYKPHEVAYSKIVLKAIEEGKKILKGENDDT